MSGSNIFSAYFEKDEIVLRAGWLNRELFSGANESLIITDDQVRDICELHIEPESLIFFLKTALEAGVKYQKKFGSIGIEVEKGGNHKK